MGSTGRSKGKWESKKKGDSVKVFASTDIGRCRESNQDCFYYSTESVGNLPNLFLVADGMGGHNAGDYASKCTVVHMVSLIDAELIRTPVQILHNVIRKVNRLLIEQAYMDASLRGMGTTLVAATIVRDELVVANIGDSRLYVIEDTIRQITKDHSYVEEMVRLGRMERGCEEYRKKKNIITRAIGANSTIQADYFHVPLQEDSQILICTDGLTNMVDDEAIRQIVQSDAPIEERGSRLIALANENGGMDNITVVLIDRKERDTSC